MTSSAFVSSRMATKVACPERLGRANFWIRRSCSCCLARIAAEYTRLLKPIFLYANFIAFIDPHIDPERPQYRDFLSSCWM
jgi:hypothetical protein